jgi:hypothetical protein
MIRAYSTSFQSIYESSKGKQVLKILGAGKGCKGFTKLSIRVTVNVMMNIYLICKGNSRGK